MTQPTFDNIQSLISSQTQNGSSVEVTFTCPTTGVEASASASIKKQAGVKADTERTVKRGLWSGLRRAVAGAIRDSLGSGTAGRIVGDVARRGLSEKERGGSYTKDEVRTAVVEAFDQVRSKFQWDQKAESWVGLQTPSTPFAELLQKAPVTETYDQGVLARAMVEIVAADGSIGDDERAFVESFLPESVGSIDELAGRDKLSATELNEVSEAARETVLTLAWACSMCDEELAEDEAARLSEMEAGLGLAAERAAELKSMAQQFLFDQALANAYPGGAKDAAAFGEVCAAATSMGLDATTIEKFDVGYRKRNGII